MIPIGVSKTLHFINRTFLLRVGIFILSATIYYIQYLQNCKLTRTS